MSLTRTVFLAAGTLLTLSAAANGASAEATGGDTDLRREIESLKATVNSQAQAIKTQAGEIARMKAEEGQEWLTKERAQEIRGIVQDVLADADARTSLQADGATAGWDKGFFLASPDGNFRLKIGGQLQVRYAVSRLSSRSMGQLDPGTYQPPQTGGFPGGNFPGGTEIRGYQGYYGQNADIERTARGFEIRRAKLDFSGHVVDPSWQYKMVAVLNQTSGQTAFNTGSYTANQFGTVGTGVAGGGGSSGPGAGGGTLGFEDLYINKVVDNNWSVKVGQFKSPFLKEELTSSKYQLAVERSLVNQMFSTKFTQGIEVTWQNDMFRVIGSFNDGGNNANTSAVIGNNAYNLGTFTEWAITGRAEWKIAGNWKQFDDFSSYRGEEFGMYVGAGVNFQQGGGDPGDPYNNTNTVAVGANGNMVAGGALFGNGATVLVPAAAVQYPNNIPTNGNDDVRNLTWTVDSSAEFGGFSLYAALVGNIATNIPAGWVANPSGGYTTLSGTGNGANVVPNNVSGIPSNGSNGSVVYFVPGYGYGSSPIFSYGLVIQGGFFVTDDVELFARYEWYNVLNNGQNDYAGNTPTFWGNVPGGSSPFANNTRTNNGGAVPNGANTPNDAYLGSNTNPYYSYNLGATPYGAQHNSIVTGGANWYPAGVKNKGIKVTADLGYSLGPVLFSNGIYGQSVQGADYRSDGGMGGGGQWVGRLQLQLLF